MPLVKQVISVGAGATSAAVLTGTTYEYISNSVSISVAAATDATSAAGGPVTMNFTMNNTELSQNAAVSKLEDEPFGATGNYVMNSTRTAPDSVRNRPIITFTNNSGGSVLVYYAVFIS
tara:strand:+ start:1241 stop:1597 length:357 start_codon:yes stop_codon:yes gene_type:complete